ncbi:MAG TPA: hypothetical protein VIH18_33495, partial [Candidatus Binatia bacterium]
ARFPWGQPTLRKPMPYLHPTVTIFLRRNAIYVAEKKPACALDETQPGGPMAFACFLIQTGSGDDMH